MLIFGFLAAATLMEPLTAWDARSIWFFHAKMIYFAGGLVRDGGWTAPSSSFSHPDYPLLVPILAAQCAKLAGFWNEQLPKFALLLLVVPVLAVTVSYWNSGLATAALLIMVWAKLVPSMTNGLMDGPLAVYGLFGVLLIGSWLEVGSKIDLATGALFICVTLGLKNEGCLVAVALLVCVIRAAILAQQGGRQLFPANRFEAIGLGTIVLLGIASGVSWQILRGTWGLQNDLHLGFGSLPSVVQRLKDAGAVHMILHSTLRANSLIYAALIGGCAIGASWVLRTGRLIEPLFCMAVGSAYLAGVEVIYLATPYDLTWHLGSSADRTTLLPALLFLAPAILLLRDEHRWCLLMQKP